jgi:hypothetical protein
VPEDGTNHQNENISDHSSSSSRPAYDFVSGVASNQATLSPFSRMNHVVIFRFPQVGDREVPSFQLVVVARMASVTSSHQGASSTIAWYTSWLRRLSMEYSP